MDFIELTTPEDTAISIRKDKIEMVQVDGTSKNMRTLIGTSGPRTMTVKETYEKVMDLLNK